MDESPKQKLSETEGQHNGEVFGITYDDTLFVTGLHFISSHCNGSDLKECHQYLYPAGVEWCGFFEVKQSENSEDQRKHLSKVKDMVKNQVLLTKTQENLKVSSFCKDEFRELNYLIMDEEDFLKIFLHMRIKGRKIMNVTSGKNKNIIQDLCKFRKQLSSGAVAFSFKDTDFFINGDNSIDVPANTTLGEINKLNIYPTELTNNTNEGLYELNISFPVSENEREGYITSEINLVSHFSEMSQIEAPLIQISSLPKNKKITRINFPIDILCVAHREHLVNNSYDILVQALYRWLDLVSLYLSKNGNESLESTPFQIYHFHPLFLNHYVTLIYPKDASDEALVDERTALHALFNLPLSQPFFRQSNALKFGKRSVTLNVHNGLRFNTGVIEGQKALVKGYYQYYHYLQDSVDDKGWGCAYRSFQTIFSWFRLQGYTTKNVPTLREIQECLVKIGDKPASFIRSRNWIGSTELSFCLDEMLSVNSKIVNVSSGQELSTLGSLLLYHFRTAGTPVMIGGGNLAHTIIGVDFNEESGAISFLILDPHFIIAGDKPYLVQIQTKGGVCWKGLNFWSQNNFYNLCFAQPPSIY